LIASRPKISAIARGSFHPAVSGQASARNSAPAIESAASAAALLSISPQPMTIAGMSPNVRRTGT
jgi:hypothetical protein